MTMVVVMVMVMVMVMVGLVLNNQYVTSNVNEYDWTNFGKDGIKSKTVKISGFAFSKKYKEAIKAFEENEEKKYLNFIEETKEHEKLYERKIRNNKINNSLVKNKKLTKDYEMDVIVEKYNNYMKELINNSNVLADDLKFFVSSYEVRFNKEINTLKRNRENHEYLMQFYA